MVVCNGGSPLVAVRGGGGGQEQQALCCAPISAFSLDRGVAVPSADYLSPTRDVTSTLGPDPRISQVRTSHDSRARVALQSLQSVIASMIGSHALRSATRSTPRRLLTSRPITSRHASTAAPPPPPPRRSQPPNPHAAYYSELLPAMIPIFLIGSAVYLSLQLLHSSLAHEQASDKAHERIAELEAEIDARLQGGSGSQGSTVEALVNNAKAWWKFW